jgi:hypothetical protein
MTPRELLQFKNYYDIMLKSMTVCIAALSNNSEKVFYCADQLATFNTTTQQVNRPDIEKITKIVPNCVILYAGTFGVTDEIIKEVKNIVLEKQKTGGQTSFAVEEIAEIVRQSFVKIRNTFTERNFLEPKNLTLSTYISRYKELPDVVINEINNNLTNFNLDGIFIVAGYNLDGICHIYKIYNPGMVMNCDTEGFASVGSAFLISDYQIAKGGYLKTKDIEDVKKIVLQAKKYSEYMPGIGETTSQGELFKEIK